MAGECESVSGVEGNDSDGSTRKQNITETFRAMSTTRLIFGDAYSLMRKLQVMVKVFMLMFKHSSALPQLPFSKKRSRKHKPFERKLLFFHS